MNTEGKAVAENMYEYAEKHDVGYYFEFAGTSTSDSVKAELDGGAVVILSTDFLGGHIVIVRRYTDDSPTRYIVNDPYGDEHNGYPNDDGDGARYTWAEMSPNWYIALYGPEYLPDLSRPAYSADGSTIVVHNGAQGAGWNANVKVCLMNSNGTLNRTVQNTSIPPHGTWSFSLYNVLGWYENFSGSATVMINQTAGSVVAENVSSSTGRAYAYNGVTPGGPGDPAFAHTGTSAYLPAIYRNYGGLWSSQVYVVNPSSATAHLTLTYTRRDGATHTSSPTPPSNGRLTSSPTSGGGPPVGPAA